MRKTGAAVSRRCLPLQTIPKPKNQHPHPGRLHSELDTPTPFSRFPSAIEQNNLSFLVLPLPLASRSCWGCLTPTIPERSTKAREALSATSQPKKSSVDPACPELVEGFLCVSKVFVTTRYAVLVAAMRRFVSKVFAACRCPRSSNILVTKVTRFAQSVKKVELRSGRAPPGRDGSG
jgi:hypothetical protein